VLKSILKVGSLAMMCAAGFCACGLNPNAKTVYADGMTAEEYRAAYQIASARCDRQTNSCSAFSSRDQCLETKLDVSAAETRLRRCSDPVDQARVASCVTEIRSRQCGTGIVHLEACAKAELCPYVSEEGMF
jgi:hypothetical protein